MDTNAQSTSEPTLQPPAGGPGFSVAAAGIVVAVLALVIAASALFLGDGPDRRRPAVSPQLNAGGAQRVATYWCDARTPSATGGETRRSS